MVYAFAKRDPLPPLPPVQGLEIRANEDPFFLSALCQLSLEHTTHRLTHHHKAYVAYLNGIPAAFGWVATQTASIGELNHAFRLPPLHRYLWNFRTLPAFRGLGIYPHLLQHIIRAELPEADYLWIMHAPENNASNRGIRKAGFTFTGKVSVHPRTGVIVETGSRTPAFEQMLERLGLKKSDEPQATCWNCSSPYLSNRKTTCCCESAGQACNQELFQETG